MTNLTPAAQQAQKRMDRELRIQAVAQQSYAVIKELREGKTPLRDLAARIKGIYRDVESAQ